MAESLLDLFDLPDDTRAIIATKPDAMPMKEFLSYLIQFGAWRYRDAYQHDRLDHIVQQMNQRLVECYRQDPHSLPLGDGARPNVVALVPKAKETA